MEIIDELETLRRGPYGGCVGYIDYSGNMDTAIAIRTLLVKDGADLPARGRRASWPTRIRRPSTRRR